MAAFEIDVAAFRAQNVGRPAQHLVREAIQNAMDEAPPNIIVTVAPASRGVHLIVEDDGPGFDDVSDVWTVFASGKRGDSGKRGRLGRGLKELISVASKAVVTTAGKRVTFQWGRGNMTRQTSRSKATGTRVECYIPSWGRKTLAKITDYLTDFVPPVGTSLVVNGVAVVRPEVLRVIDRVILQTVVYDIGGVPEEKWEYTSMVIYSQPRTWVYEMGIPVERISEDDGFQWSIDVQQRTPIRPDRDMLPRNFVHCLYAEFANHMMAGLNIADMTSLWMEEAIGHHSFDATNVGELYTERRFGRNAARALVSDPHDRNVKAAQESVTVVRTSDLSANVRELVKKTLPTTGELYPAVEADTKFIPHNEWTQGELRFVAFIEFIAERLGLVVPNISIVDAPDACVEADSANSGTLIRVNRGCLGQAFFDRPCLAAWSTLAVHELAHRTGNGHDAVFWRELETLFGRAVEVCMNECDVVRQLLSDDQKTVA